MASSYFVLGQANPAATTNTDVYTVTTGRSAVVSTINVANLGVSGTYRIAVRPAGATLASKHYLVYDAPLNANDSIAWTIGPTLASTDIITVQASNTSFAFTVFGAEIY